MSAKGGKAFIIVGAPGMGKTTFVKNILKRVHPGTIWLYDVNNEYTEIINQPLLDFDVFCKEAMKKRESILVFEEATIFLSNKGSNNELKNILVRKRHTHNTILLVFHSLRYVPKYLLDLCNYMALYKTNDPEEKAIELGNENILNAYREIKSAPMLKNDVGREYSPHKIVTLSP